MRVTAPIPMSAAVVDDILAAFRERLLVEADEMITRSRRSCEQYQAELRWLLPTSPFAKRQLASVLHDREISQSRFTLFVREEPGSAREGMERLFASLEERWEQLYAARPSDCQVICPWRPHPKIRTTATEWRGMYP